ncbi:MAG: S-methyl-5-thioribose-1-phosphate isomerase [Candidatus Omnitrophica bacterium]|nr:S-methyl-5-thioribose-1-phosphate isomerase [Candidatus Omnitrophota bacterium]
MSIQTITWSRGKIKLIDQTLLPNKFKYVYCNDLKSVWKAIKILQVRGAPAIGVVAAFGVIIGIKDSKAKDYKTFEKELKKVCKYLAASRPTAVNLFWALDRMQKTAAQNFSKTVTQIKKILLKEAKQILEEDRRICRKMAGYGAGLIKNNDTLLTHCNAGALATADYGTALGVMYMAREKGKKIKVYADETRPLLQGARLTTWELMKHKIDVTLICDNMAAVVMQEGKIDKVIVGADRIASNGDAANKIGTYGLAVLARAHGIPFYVAAPVSTFDPELKSGKQIPIEQRKPEEITACVGRRIAPCKVKVYNPAFDVTPARLVTAFITEKGVIKPPYKTNLRKILK